MLFGVPNRKVVAVEKEQFPNNAIITLLPFKGKGTSRSIGFNKKIAEILGLSFENAEVPAQVSFSFDTINHKIFVANTTGLTGVAEVKVAKTSMTASDKKYFEAIRAHFESPAEETLLLEARPSGEEFNNCPLLEISLYQAKEVVVENESVFPGNEQPGNQAAVVEDLQVNAPEYLEEVASSEDIQANDALVAEESVVPEEIEEDPFTGFVN
jgi:hypothetical protein